MKLKNVKRLSGVNKSDRILASGALHRIPSGGSKNRIYEFSDIGNGILAVKSTVNDRITIVDLEDKDKIKDRTWNLKSTGRINDYARTSVIWDLETVTINLSRLIMSDNSEMYHNGNVVDHKNGNTFDNRKDNLRICSPQENTINRVRFDNRNHIFEKDDGTFEANIINKGKRYYKYTKDRKEAEQFVEDIKTNIFGEFNPDLRKEDTEYQETINRIKNMKSPFHFDDEKLEKRYNYSKEFKSN